MDGIAPLLETRTDILSPSDYNYSVSFISVVPPVVGTVAESVRSINRIGEELGRDFEIILVYPPSNQNLKDKLRPLDHEITDLIPLLRDFGTFGRGKQIAFEESTGRYIVPFSSKLIYPIEYADILHGFLKFRTRRLFFSELPLINRDLIIDVGGWRDLDSGEDVDLYSRIAMNYGVLACPSGLLSSKEQVSSETISLRDSGEFLERKFSDQFRIIRDTIIACNHSLSDIRELVKIRRETGHSSKLLTYLISYFRSRIYHIRPIMYTRNNLVILMESILESLILKEYNRLSVDEDLVTLRLDPVILRFLLSRSKLFRDMRSSLEFFLKDQL
ncbi:hypothetical protein ApAK_04220 [Thermoplasmatales archaeon AK]|nr:hypothetical protein [Thermoplasmatales archaeon AK]